MRSPRTTAALLFALSVTFGVSRAFAEEPAVNNAGNEDEARSHFKAGVAYLQDPEGERYEEAYAEFKKAYEVSKSPRVLGNVALCAMMLERDGEAIEAYTRYLKEVPDVERDEQEQNTRDLETLVAGAAHVKVAIDPRAGARSGPLTVYDTRTPVRGAPVANVYGPFNGSTELVIRPGRHVLFVKVGGAESEKWEVDTAPGARSSHEFRIEDTRSRVEKVSAPEPSPSRVGPVALIGVGGAALVAGGILGVVSLGKTRSIEDRCPNDACSASAYRDVESARTYVRMTDFLLLGGGVITAAGIGWLVLSPSSPPSDTSSSRRAGHPRIVVGVSGYGGTLRMRF
jgi:hypothetical protein